MARIPLVVGNWKMELSHKSEMEVARALKNLLRRHVPRSEVVICPSYAALPGVSELVADADFLALGAQNIHWEEKGAWTGQVSVLQVSPFARWSIIGHSEQRTLTGESDQEVQRKIDLLLKHGLSPIVCVGETAEEQHRGVTVAKVTAQMQVMLQKLTRTSLNKIAIAYEPIWAIGSGLTPEPNEMAGIMLLIRRIIAERFDAGASEKVRILYGGSVTGRNVGSFMAEPGVDGVLVGGASVHPAQFADIVAAVDAASGRKS